VNVRGETLKRIVRWTTVSDMFSPNEINDSTSGLERKSVAGGVWTLTAEILTYASRVGAMVFLARLLAPEHFGLIGMVTAVTVLAERFKDLGLDIPTIQKKTISKGELSTLFWLNGGFGIVITIGLALCAPLLSWFYGEPQLQWICIALSAPIFSIDRTDPNFFG